MDVSETATIGLVIGNIMWPSVLGALFLSRVWRVSTATKTKKAERAEPAPAAETLAPAKPSLRAS